MNLASILNLSALTPPQPGAPTGAVPADPALVAEFAALLGLAGEAASTGKALPVTGGKSLPELPELETLPATLPVEPPVVLLAMPPVQLLSAEHLDPNNSHEAKAVPVVLPALRQAPPSLAAKMPDAAPSVAPLPALQAAAPPVFEGRSAVAPVLIAVPLPIQQQIKVPLPVQVQAQVQAATALAQQPDPTSQQLAVAAMVAPAVAPAPAPAPASRMAELLPSAAILAVAEPSELSAESAHIAPLPVAATTPLLADPPRGASIDPLAPTITSTPTADRHDFSAIVDRLTEARDLARPGRAALQLAHRDFGPISVQFDMAGPSLKVAMTSPDVGFAPAVEAALSERPIAATGDAARTDSQGQRFDQSAPPPAPTSSGPSAQNDGQRPDQNGRNNAPRHLAEQVRGQSQAARDDGDETAARRARDGSLFA